MAPGQPLAALVPLDASGLDRIEAIARLLRALRGRKIRRDGRLTAQQRRRACHMLQAVDGHMNGADHRDIAEAIFGQARITAHPWKTSSLRDTVKALVRDGLVMIDGGYRALLLRRHRP